MTLKIIIIETKEKTLPVMQPNGAGLKQVLQNLKLELS